MKQVFIILLLVLVLPQISSTMFAQTGVGKISGNVIDADTKEPLIGANIILVNTNLGAATDIDGNYFILNVTPGTYEVKISFVGYAPKTIQEVRVVANITYELDVELSTDFTLPDIVVVDKKFFEAKTTNTVKVIDSDQISRLPVRGVANIASLQSGVVVQEGSGGQEGNATINVRGGRGSEVLYIVDGVPQNNLYNRGTVAQVSNIAIDQISFQVGGYEAKYGQSQSGIVNVTTKSGQPYYNLFVDVQSSDFLNTDASGSNLYSGSLSGPIIPGIPEHTIFLSGERGWYQDADPPAVPLEFWTLENGTVLNDPIVYESIPNNPASVWRFNGKINSRFGDWNFLLSALLNNRISKNAKGGDAPSQYKNASQFIEETDEANSSYSARISQMVSSRTFWNLNLGYRLFQYQRYNPFLKGPENQILYGDSLWWANSSGMNVTLAGDGKKVVDYNEFGEIILGPGGTPAEANVDENGVFNPYGWARNLFQQREDTRIGADFDLTTQLDNNLLEFGLGIEQHTVRGYGNWAHTIAGMDPTLPDYIKFAQTLPWVFGYDVTGMEKTDSDYPASLEWFADPSIEMHPTMAVFLRPRKPIIGYLYLQDKLELKDLVLNFGLRMDYFDIKSHEFINPALPFGDPNNPNNLDLNKYDIGDFKLKDVEIEYSPRIGIGFPVTESTVFHAQYGRFIQLPELNNMYGGPFDQMSFNGGLISEKTIQYEVGFRQLIGINSALNVTAFYKNTKSLVDGQLTQYQEVVGGEILNRGFYGNVDFGTIKGFAFSFDITRLSYLSASIQYTLSFADGTGSSTSSNLTALFRNLDNQPAKVIAPLDFDQRHTAVAILDFYIPEGELGFFELFNANAIISFNSGRPYTPVDQWNLLGDNTLVADNTGYVNCAYGPSNFRIDLKVEKGFKFGDFYLTPYVWIENLFDTDNVVAVWRSTGSPYTTGWLNDPDAQGTIQQQGEGYVKDYETLEKDPNNFGIPRLIKLGLKLNFDKINF